MKRIMRLGLIACLLCTQASAQDTQAKKVLLKWKWKKGQVLRYRMSMSQTQTMTGSENRTLENETTYYWI
ncbi:MAG: hypothetical protein P1V97_33675, partial [Planctomycetota bacterium]|nr:hypothetical protein [Planctomycetota bacterium]